MTRLASLVALAALTACGPAAQPDNQSAPIGNTELAETPVPPPVAKATATATAASVALNVAPGAISLVDMTSGSARELAFGTVKDMVVTAAIRALGEPRERGVNNECGEGAMDYVAFDGLTLWFAQDKLAGWSLNGAAGRITTAAGVGVGSPRAAVFDAYAVKDVAKSTLGREFSTQDGSFSGLLDKAGASAKVTSLWSGQACLFR